uniref:Amino acid permease/ SLC12A domain-containing protein n=1 Tax=Bionectria ochroleuca TaxID=29856 RepID=A0A8H7KEF9_BIOOC
MEKNNAADPELGVDYEKVDMSTHEANPLASKQVSVQDVPKTRMRSFMDSFKPADGDANSPPEQAHEPSRDDEHPSAPPEKLARKLKSRHMKLMAIASCVGTGLFVGSGKALASGGPASLLIAYGLIGIMMYYTIYALSEMGVLFPVAGSFAAFSTRFLDPAWGFAMGWNYTISWLVTLPLEITAASMTIDFWPGARGTNSAAWVAIFWVMVVSINLLVSGAEFIFSTIKVITVIGFIILGIIIDCGGSPSGDYIGGRYWHSPGAFNNGFKGLCSVFVTAAFAYGGTEVVGLAAAEAANPRKALPAAVKQVFWRIILFYVLCLIVIGLLVPYNSPDLMNGSGSADANASPFVISIRNAGINGLPSVINVVILMSILSVGNAAVYGSSRTLAAMADQGQAPKILGYVDRSGRPLVAIICTALIGLVAFIVAAGPDVAEQAFDWMLAIAGLAQIFNWGSICLAHIRLRLVYGSWLGFIINCLIVIAQFWTGFAPVGYESMTALERTESWFQSCLSLIIILITYLGFKFWKKTKIWRAKDLDLVSGQRVLNLTQILEAERMERKSWSAGKRICKFLC